MNKFNLTKSGEKNNNAISKNVSIYIFINSLIGMKVNTLHKSKSI